MLCQSLLYSEMNQLYVYTYPLFFGFPFHLGHPRALSRVPCAIQQVLISYLFYTQYQQCVYVDPSLCPFYHIPPSYILEELSIFLVFLPYIVYSWFSLSFTENLLMVALILIILINNGDSPWCYHHLPMRKLRPREIFM